MTATNRAGHVRISAGKKVTLWDMQEGICAVLGTGGRGPGDVFGQIWPCLCQGCYCSPAGR